VSAVFAKQLKPAATDVRDIFKGITPNLDNTAHSFSNVFVQALNVASTKANMAAWKTTIDASSTAVTNVGGAFGPLIDIVARLFQVAAPIFAALTAGATDWATRLDARVAAAAADGRLAAWINNGIAKFKELSDKVIAGFDSIRNGLSKFASFRLDILQAIWPALAPILTGLGNFISAHPTLAVWLLGIGIALNVLAGIISVITPIIAAFDAVLDANPISLIIIAIAALVIAFIALLVFCKPFRDFWIGLWHDIQNIVSAVVDYIKIRWQLWAAAFQSIGSTIGNIAGTIGRFFSQTIPNAVGTMVNWIQDRWNSLLGFFGGLGSRIASIFGGVWNGITNGLKSALNWVIDRLNSFHVNIPSWVPIIGGDSFGFNIPHLALGGAVQAGMPYIVGDGGGPEIFVPRQSGSVVGTKDTADILGGGGGDIVLNIDLGEGITKRIRIANKQTRRTVNAGFR
jgi:phage-related protein